MAEITRPSDCNGCIDFDFVERELTPRRLMKLGIRLHLAGLPLSNTVRELDKFGVERSRKVVHDWVHKADLQPASDASLDHAALDETVIKINEQQFWLYAAVDPKTNEFLRVLLFTTITTALTQRLLRDLREKHDGKDAVFLVGHAHHLAATLQRTGLPFRPERHGNWNAVERIFREIKRRTSSFSSCFSNVDPATAEPWLQAFPVWWNSLN